MTDEQEGHVEPQEEQIDTNADQQPVADLSQDAGMQDDERTQVPLSALQKERKRRQEVEQELQWERQQRQQVQAPPEDDSARYESATREDLSRSQNESIRIIEERLWIKQNPEKFEYVNENLQQFLKQRPHLADALKKCPNRYEEAFELMDKLTPRQQQQMSRPAAAPKKEAPGSPSGAPKAASLNQAVDVMTMSDAEFAAWRQSKKQRR